MRLALPLRSVVAAGLLAAIPFVASAAPEAEPGLVPITVHAERIERFGRFGEATRFGEFEFRGGLILSSSAPRFGGLSGLDLRSDGESFVGVSDLGRWLTGRLVRSAGRLVGISDMRWGPMLNAEGQPLARRRLADAESLSLAPGGAYVSFEQSNDLKFYRFTADPGLARPRPVALPRAVRGMIRNKGLETVALAPADGPLAGSPVLVAERSLDANGNHRAFIVNGPRAGVFSVVRSDDYDVTDGAFMPNGDLLLLERRVTTIPIAVGMRLRRIAGDAIRPGAVVDGPVALEASMADQIDNMEGLAISTDPDGRMRVTIVSDDNLNRFQRTMLLEFVWLGPAVADTE